MEINGGFRKMDLTPSFIHYLWLGIQIYPIAVCYSLFNHGGKAEMLAYDEEHPPPFTTYNSIPIATQTKTDTIERPPGCSSSSSFFGPECWL
jgi:hypothetical protein